ncbi:MAG: hypothetical protein Kow00108_15990 [Calditrichia bacterium]
MPTFGKHIYDKLKIMLLIANLLQFITKFLTLCLIFVFFSFILIYIFKLPIAIWQGTALVLFFLIGSIAGIYAWSYRFRFSRRAIQNGVSDILIQSQKGGEKFVIIQELMSKSNSQLDILALRALEKDINEQEEITIKKFASRYLEIRALLTRGIITCCLMILLFSINERLQAFWQLKKPAYLNTPMISFADYTQKSGVMENDSVVFKVKINGEGDNPKLIVMNEDGRSMQYALRKVDSLYHSRKIRIKKSVSYRYQIKTTTFSNEQRILSSEIFHLPVREIPDFKKVEFRIIPPNYTNLNSFVVNEIPASIEAYRFSRILIYGLMNVPLKSFIIFQDSIRDLVKMNTDKVSFEWKTELDNSISYTYCFKLDGIDKEFYYPIRTEVQIKRDLHPQIILIFPKNTFFLSENLTVPFRLRIQDDFGFERLELVTQKIDENGQITEQNTIDVSSWMSEGSSQLIVQNYPVFNWFLLPGEKIEAVFRLKDNYPYDHQFVISDTVTIILPFMTDQFAMQNDSLDAILDKLNQHKDELYRNKKMLEQLSDKMKQKETLDFADKEKLNQIAGDIEKNRKKISETGNELKNQIDKINQHNYLSEETLKKYFEMQRMLQNIADDELKNLLENLQNAMKDNKINDLQKNLDDIASSMDQFEKEIERLYDLMKIAELEKKFEQLLKINKEILSELDKLNQNRDNKYDKRTENLKLTSSFFKKELEKTAEEMIDIQKETGDSLRQIAKTMERKKIPEKIERVQSSRQNESNEAESLISQLSEDFRDIYQRLQEANEQFGNSVKNEIRMKIKIMINDLLQLSHYQEQLNRTISHLKRFSTEFDTLGLDEYYLLDQLKRVRENLYLLSKKTFLFNPAILQLSNRSIENLESMIKDLENRLTPKLKKKGEEVVSAINIMTYLLLEMDKNVSQSSTSTGIEELMKQLEAMAKQQAGVNKQSMQMFQQQSGRLRPDPDALSRLKAQQEMIKRSMEYLNSKYSNNPGNLKNQLKGIEEDLKKIVEEFNRNRISPKLIERQKRVLDRMLSSTRSMQEKNETEERKAETAKTYEGISPEWDERKSEYENQLLEMIQMLNNLDIDEQKKKTIIKYYEKLLSD